MRTFFDNFTKDDGASVTVEYSVSGSYVAPSYSPMSGADSGDVPEFTVVSAWPATDRYHDMLGKRYWLWQMRRPWNYPWTTIRIVITSINIWLEERAARLTEAEEERFLDWAAEHHVEEDDNDDDYYEMEAQR